MRNNLKGKAKKVAARISIVHKAAMQAVPIHMRIHGLYAYAIVPNQKEIDESLTRLFLSLGSSLE